MLLIKYIYDMDDLLIKKALISNKILPNLKGYKYCFEVVKLLLKEDLPLKKAYEVVGVKYKVKANSVEKSVSNAISKAFLSREMQERYVNLCYSTGKINNKTFIKILKEQIIKV